MIYKLINSIERGIEVCYFCKSIPKYFIIQGEHKNKYICNLCIIRKSIK